MRSKEDLRRTLQRIDGRGYKAYKDIEGQYDFGPYRGRRVLPPIYGHVSRGRWPSATTWLGPSIRPSGAM